MWFLKKWKHLSRCPRCHKRIRLIKVVDDTQKKEALKCPKCGYLSLWHYLKS